MLIAYWIVAGVLALAYFAAGAMKAFRSPDALVAGGIAWAKDVSLPLVRVIGVVEVLGALGLLLPPLTGIAPVLAPLAAIGLALVQVGAVIFHVRRGEAKVLPMNLVLLLLAVAAAIVGFLVWV
ncbi:DoxX family protein [Microbacterium hominis]|uniref:DoxX family protein n=1 Tax=Microbacterium hominis TaxID=162426 RepID=UPI0019657AEF|nr:DoxX family protein [Microbacterium hominis]QRY39683.1 DoxX family protein [Microbacterium hominis]